ADSTAADLHRRPLAHGHHAAARTARPRSAPQLSNDVRVPGPESFLANGKRADAPVRLDDAVAPTDGQHGCRLGPAAGRRVRPLHARLTVAVLEDRFPQPAGAVSGLGRRRGDAAGPTHRLDARLLSPAAGAHVQGSAPARPQVADALLPNPDTVGT